MERKLKYLLSVFPLTSFHNFKGAEAKFLIEAGKPEKTAHFE